MKNKRLRIFWSSNAMWSDSGYGSAVQDLLPRIRDLGYPLAICNFYGQSGIPFEFPYECRHGEKIDHKLAGIRQYPIINHAFGSDGALWHSKDFKADVVFFLQDIWPLNPQDLQGINRPIFWVPVDHDPIPRGTLNNLRFANRIIAMSKFGKQQLADNGFSSIYIPHMVDTKIFYPMHTQEIKQKRGIPPDVYVFGMVAANKDNPPRKSFQEVLEAFKAFLSKVPKAMLYIHTDPHFPGGFLIDEYAKTLGIQQNVFFPGIEFPGIYDFKYNTDKKKMAQIYNTFDCLLAPCTSEGFGVPIIEAQACGVPVITSDWVAMKELVPPEHRVTPSSLKWTSMMSYAATPSVDDLFNKMMAIYQFQPRKQLKDNAHKFAQQYDLSKNFKERWIPLLESLEKEIYPDESIDKTPKKPQTNITAPVV